MRRLLATLLAVHCCKQDEATKPCLDSTPTNRDPELDPEYSEKEITYLEYQANDPYAYRATQGFCARQSRDCTTCGRVNASRCHQRKCFRRQYGGGGCCGGRRRARQLAAPRGIAVGTASAQEHGVTDYGVERRDGGYRADSKSVGGSRASEKEVEAGYANGYESRVEKDVELPPYKG